VLGKESKQLAVARDRLSHRHGLLEVPQRAQVRFVDAEMAEWVAERPCTPSTTAVQGGPAPSAGRGRVPGERAKGRASGEQRFVAVATPDAPKSMVNQEGAREFRCPRREEEGEAEPRLGRGAGPQRTVVASRRGPKTRVPVLSRRCGPRAPLPPRVRLLRVLIETEYVEVPVDGLRMGCLLAHPAGEGTWPGIVFYSDIFQLTGPTVRWFKRLAGHGFVVLAPEIYHRIEPAGTVSPSTTRARTGARRTPRRPQ
jgi:hypothetical protein